MRTTFDLSPLTRSTIGFDRMFRLLDSVSGTSDVPSYPPYNIVKHGDDKYSITVAVAGFGEDELDVKVQDGQLIVSSTPEKAEKEDVSYLHRGIARRAFELRFSLADYIEVTGASVDNGMLTIDLVRNVPEAMKPRTIAIGKGGGRKALAGENKAA
jgi:molecular chaperone IbpA